MKISEAINRLEELHGLVGDVEVVTKIEGVDHDMFEPAAIEVQHCLKIPRKRQWLVVTVQNSATVVKVF